MINTIFIILFLLSLLGIVVGLVKPSLIKIKSRKYVLIYVGGAMLLFFILAGATSTPQEIRYSVTNVVDGDTIDVNIEGKTTRVRLIGIDAPEISENECYNNESFAKAKELLLNKKLILEADQTQDNKDIYGRLLRYVFLEDGRNFNLYMIKDGYAIEYTYDKSYKYQAEFKEAQTSAKSESKGLWKQDACIGKSEEYKEPPQEITEPSSLKPIENNKETVQPTIVNTTSFDSCGSKTKCGQMISCEEARYYLTTCGLSRLDGDKDGIPCESLCL